MCGIAGWVAGSRGGRNAAPDESALAAMLETLVHRGTGNGSGAQAEQLCGLVDRNRMRQAVLGAALCDPGSGISLALDGDIANAGELRAELAKRGYAFARGTGAELLLRAYQRWDQDVARHLRGAFAFAIWDSSKDRLLLARDRFGEKPLYVHEGNGGFYFASEVKALLKVPGIAPEVDLRSVWETLAYGHVPGPATLFSGIRKLPPATTALWQFDRLREVRYWTPPDRNALDGKAPGAQAADAVEGFVSQLDEAVRLRGGGGVFLSGGLDSAALVALLSRNGGAVKTFSIGFEGDRASELPQAARVAKHFGTAHQEIVVAPRELVADLARLVASRDAPSSRPSDLALYRLAREAGRSVRTVLTGEGCDEILGGYGRHVAERFAWGFSSVPGLFALATPLARSAQSRTALAGLKLGDWQERYIRWTGALTRKERERLSTLDLNGAAARAGPPFDADPRASRLRRVLYFDQTSSLPDQLLERNDRAGAAASLDARLPFLDHRLAEYVSALPDDRRVRGLSTKWILRQAVRQLIPGELGARKAGFRVPVRDLLRNELRDTLLDHLHSGASRTRKYYDPPTLDRLLDEHLRGKSNHENPLWTLLNLEIWHRQYSAA